MCKGVLLAFVGFLASGSGGSRCTFRRSATDAKLSNNASPNSACSASRNDRCPLWNRSASTPSRVNRDASCNGRSTTIFQKPKDSFGSTTDMSLVSIDAYAASSVSICEASISQLRLPRFRRSGWNSLVASMSWTLPLRALALRLLSTQIGRNAGIVEDVERQSDDRLQPVVLDDPAADITLARSGFAREQGRSVMDVGDPRAERRILHLGQLVDQEQQLAVRDTRQQAQPIVITGQAIVLDNEARIVRGGLAAHLGEVDLPGCPERRVGHHEVELKRVPAVRIGGQGRAEGDIAGLLALALEQQVGLANGVGLGRG
jgi:hypothetical protein